MVIAVPRNGELLDAARKTEDRKPRNSQLETGTNHERMRLVRKKITPEYLVQYKCHR